MELLKQTGELEYKWKDVTFKLRAHATARDKHELAVLGVLRDDGKVTVPSDKLYRRAIELFVKEWHGVTDGGIPIPFSMSALDNLPADADGDLFIKLGGHILINCLPQEDAPQKKAV